ELDVLVRELLARRRHIYLCTHGMFIRRRLHEFEPSSRFFFNVHLDGLEATHDMCVERPGVFREAIAGIKAAKAAGFLVCTNTTPAWKAPCCPITAQHHATCKDFLEKTPWEQYGRGRDPRCEDCMVHVGYEPSAVLGANRRLGDSWKLLKWQLSASHRAEPLTA